MDTIAGTYAMAPSELDSWLDVSRRLAASDAVAPAVAGRLRVLSARLRGDLGRTRSAVRVAVFPAEQQAFEMSLTQTRARRELAHATTWRCRTCGRSTAAPQACTDGPHQGAHGSQPISRRDQLLAAGATEAAVRIRGLVQRASDVLAGVVRDAVPCPACGGLERVQGSDPACPRDGTPQRETVLGKCLTCRISVLGPPVSWLPATPPAQLGKRELAIAVDTADPQEPVVLLHGDEAGLLSLADQAELLQVALLLTTLPPVDQPQPLTDVLMPLARRLAAHLLVPARGARLLTVSPAERDVLDTVAALFVAGRAAESRRKLICVSCGHTRPDDRDARRRQQDLQRRRTLLTSAASAGVLSVVSQNPAPLALVVKSLMLGRSGAPSSCPACAEPVAVSAPVPVCPRCLSDVRVPSDESCTGCGHRFALGPPRDSLFARSADQVFWVDLAHPVGKPPLAGVFGRGGRDPSPEPVPLVRSVDGAVRLEDGDVVVHNSAGGGRLPTHLIRDVVLIEPHGADPGWLRFVPAGGPATDAGRPPVRSAAAAAAAHLDPVALLIDPPQLPAALSVQAWLRSRRDA
ncbi:hypothetical protein [Modestobacter italicus]|uniref:hypothetical protein n=1 Tax=Modestobacter italicus (strain DSM 44449 / CECT 9708 / BC 501) TaxID=2732864 RepID=UPI0014124CCA|nr:hypothetical protein [Modestobacter marinus]